MSTSTANLWNTPRAEAIASEIAGYGGYCGPAVVVWIAAVWNEARGITYSYMSRLTNKSLFPDGPRDFTGMSDLPGFQVSLKTILERETGNALSLSDDTSYRYGTIHDELERYDMPIIIRMKASEFRDGLHYVTLYKSTKDGRSLKTDRIKFCWQDNGYYGRKDDGNPGLHVTGWRNVGTTGSFKFGSKRVVQLGSGAGLGGHDILIHER